MLHDSQTYTVFCIDPPWPQNKGGIRSARPNQNRQLDYTTLSVNTIFSILDGEIFVTARDQHTVFMWSIDKFLSECDVQMENRGYRRHARMIWDKQNGIAPAFSIRFCHEYVTWWYKPKFMPVDISSRGKYKTVFSEKPRQHSRKPEIFYDMVEHWYPNNKKMDVFSRQTRNGWDQFGDQCNHFPVKGLV